MSNKHTPEPWKADDAVTFPLGFKGRDMSVYDFHRACDCVNALSGIPDPEQWVADMKAENERLKAIVESVKKVIYPSEAKYYDEMVAEIESILNKANY